MYEEYFGLQNRPFAETVCPSAYVAMPSREAVLRRLRYGLEHNQGPSVLFGPPGTGKTMISRRMADDLGLVPVHLSFTAMPSADLLALLADEFTGSAAESPSFSSSYRRLRDKFAASVDSGTRPLLIVDDAHLIDDSASYDTLRLLLSFASAGPPDLALLLVGTSELLLQLPPALNDRLTACVALAPLTASESSLYITGRLRAAGATAPLFTPEAMTAIHDSAGGLPRRLNHLADLALLVSYAEDRRHVDPRAVAVAARDSQLDILAA